MSRNFVIQEVGFGQPQNSEQAKAASNLVKKVLSECLQLARTEHFVTLIDNSVFGSIMITTGCNTMDGAGGRIRLQRLHNHIVLETYKTASERGCMAATMCGHRSRAQKGKVKQGDSQNVLGHCVNSMACAVGYSGDIGNTPVNGTVSNVTMDDNALGFPIEAFVAVPQDVLSKEVASTLREKTIFNNVQWCARYVLHTWYPVSSNLILLTPQVEFFPARV